MVASGRCSTTWGSPFPTSPRPSASTAPCSPCSASSSASHADAELVEWEDWDIGPTDGEHAVTRGLHVGFRAPDRAACRRLLAGRDRRRSPERRRTRAAHGLQPRLLRRFPARSGRQQRRGGSRRPRAPRARRWHRPPAAPRPRPAGVAALLHDDRAICRDPPHARRAGTRRVLRPRLLLLACARRAPAHRAHPPRLPRGRGRHGAGLPRRRARRGLRGPRRTPASALYTTRATTGRSCSTRTATTSRSSTTTTERAPQDSGELPNDIGRSFVLTQTEEARLTQPTFARPFGKSDLCDKLRPRPVCSGQGPAGHRRTVGLRSPPVRAAARRACAASRRCSRCRPSRRTGADRPRNPPTSNAPNSIRLPRGSVYPPIARTSCSRAPLQLQPVPRAAVGVGCVGALCNQPLPAGAAGLVEAALCVAAERVAELKAIARTNGSLEARAPFEQRSARDVLTVELEQVEHAVDDGVREDKVCRRRPHPGAAAGDRTTSGPRRMRRSRRRGEVDGSLGRDRSTHLRVPVSEIRSARGLELYLGPALPRDAAFAVELSLQQPVVAEITAIAQGCKHQRERHPGIITEYARFDLSVRPRRQQQPSLQASPRQASRPS